MSANQIGGFFNRLEASRKYLFGSMGVLGETNNSVISGVLIARGQDIKPVVDVAPDWESYEFKKLDLENPEDKAFFEAACAWDLEIDGKKWVDGKNVSATVMLLLHSADVSLRFLVQVNASLVCRRVHDERCILCSAVFLDLLVSFVHCSNKNKKELEDVLWEASTA